MLEARPPAKVNLTLEIGRRRPDGFHELASVILRVGLCDRLTMVPGSEPTDQLKVIGLPGTPVDGNLVLRALQAVRAYTGVNFAPQEVTLEKHIPAASGLGGGSSDAAYALKMAQVEWGVRVRREDELKLAESLGSDVPFFYFDYGTALVTGRGEQVEPLGLVDGLLSVLLLHPPFELSTPRVFARYDDLQSSSGRPSERSEQAPSAALNDLYVLNELGTEQIVAWAAATPEPNDLWPAAISLEPSLAVLRDRLEATTQARWLMSGSGPTLFGLYPSLEAAVDAGKLLVRDAAATLEKCRVNAVHLVGPDPAWRYP